MVFPYGLQKMRRASQISIRLLFVVFLLAGSAVGAAETRVFREGRAAGAELKYINDLPVLIVSGTPEEIGRQKAALTAEVMKAIADYPRRLLERSGHKDRLPKYLEMSKALAHQIPADHRAELRAFAQQSGIDRDTGILANTLADIYRDISCSSLIVESE